jgi:hypothetical protein
MAGIVELIWITIVNIYNLVIHQLQMKQRIPKLPSSLKVKDENCRFMWNCNPIYNNLLVWEAISEIYLSKLTLVAEAINCFPPPFVTISRKWKSFFSFQFLCRDLENRCNVALPKENFINARQNEKNVYTGCTWNTCVNYNQWKNSPVYKPFL